MPNFKLKNESLIQWRIERVSDTWGQDVQTAPSNSKNTDKKKRLLSSAFEKSVPQLLKKPDKQKRSSAISLNYAIMVHI